MPADRRTGFRRRPLSLTSLIDVVFLLLLFFMLTSTFTRHREITLPSAGAGAATAAPAPVFLRLGPDEILVNGRASTLADLAASVGDMAGASGTPVLVSLAQGVTAQRLVDVLSALGGFQVQVLG